MSEVPVLDAASVTQLRRYRFAGDDAAGAPSSCKQAEQPELCVIDRLLPMYFHATEPLVYEPNLKVYIKLKDRTMLKRALENMGKVTSSSAATDANASGGTDTGCRLLGESPIGMWLTQSQLEQKMKEARERVEARKPKSPPEAEAAKPKQEASSDSIFGDTIFGRIMMPFIRTGISDGVDIVGRNYCVVVRIMCRATRVWVGLRTSNVSNTFFKFDVVPSSLKKCADLWDRVFEWTCGVATGVSC